MLTLLSISLSVTNLSVTVCKPKHAYQGGISWCWPWHLQPTDLLVFGLSGAASVLKVRKNKQTEDSKPLEDSRDVHQKTAVWREKRGEEHHFLRAHSLCQKYIIYRNWFFFCWRFFRMLAYFSSHFASKIWMMVCISPPCLSTWVKRRFYKVKRLSFFPTSQITLNYYPPDAQQRKIL